MNIHIHRLLDEAFDGVEQTPEARDLKEEVRANLVARVEELEASGRSPEDAAQTRVPGAAFLPRRAPGCVQPK